MASTVTTAIKQTLVIIDAGIDDYQILKSGILPTAKVTVLNKHTDGITQISALCSNYPAASIQIIAHGSPGCLQLGNSQLNLDNLHSYSQQLQQWQATEILIYGCEVAQGEQGKSFIQKLHQITKANIAASAGKIGNAQQGGSWELEHKLGEITSDVALSAEIRQAYPGVLVTFTTATNFSVGTSPYSVTVGYFNGDSILDLAVANSGSNNVSVLLGDGLDGFGTATNFSVGTSPYSVTVGYFNGDSILDLAVANSGSNNVSVLLGDGLGGFGTATNFTVGTSPYSVTVGDFNGDSILDLAVANSGSNTVSVLLGDGLGNFGTATNFTVGTSPYSVTVGDFNGDGKLDLATANENSSNVSVLLGNGSGGFGTPTNFTVGNAPQSVTVGDFNGDGKLDLATANENSSNVSVLLSTTKISIAAGTNPKEGIADGTFTITLDSPAPNGGLTVNFNTNGSNATTTNDYTLEAGTNITAVSGNTFTIAPGQTTATLRVVAVADNVTDPNETVTLNLESGSDYILDTNNTATLTIVEPVAPVITLTSTTPITYTENDAATTIDSSLTVNDVNSTNLNSATISITSDSIRDGDILEFTNQNGITGSYSDGVLTLTGTATVAQYQTALRSVKYRNSSDNPSTTTRTISFVVNDGDLDSNTVTRNISVSAVDDAPTIIATSRTLQYTENATTAIDSNLIVNDPDSTNLTGATVSITSGFVSTEDILSFTNQNGITGRYSNGVLTLTGTATVDQYQEALRSITYRNRSEKPSTVTRTISFVVNNNFSSNTATRNINVSSVNDAPVVVTTKNAVKYINNSSITIDSNITVTDVDSPNLTIAVIRINDGFNSLEDILEFTEQNGINGDYDNGFLTLSGTATVAQYQAALRSIKYRNSSDNPSTGTRTISFLVYDGVADSIAVTRNVNVGINEATGLTNPKDDVFFLSGENEKVRLKVQLTGRSANVVNELGFFTVDDPQGTIDGIAPGANGYAEAALTRSKVILSALKNNPNGFDYNNLSTILELDNSQNFRFLLVTDGTLDSVRNNSSLINKLLFSSVTTQKVTDLGENAFSVGWKDPFNNNATEFNHLVVRIQQTDQDLPLGTNLQNNSQAELIDLRDVQTAVKAEFSVYREATYDNYVGFYQVVDENGGIDTNGDGKVDLLTGQAGYIEAAVRNRVAGIDLAVSNQGSASLTGTFQPGGIFVPFIIVNGRPDALLDSNPNNDPAIYFPFLGANADKTDHIRLLGNNTFGFEDISGGGDRDFNDLIVKINLSTVV
ncbi:DUF4347 domain-containing protein [Nostoc sp. FACHB-87]|uniref:DUF4347 domain-containing protein n=1 Tax=Nostocaceae TaxID=1162 RepID=UPI001681CAC4|nr:MULTISPECIES: DUF4347 domain-containing protein [Nostocaceae]MBD2454299.1 DUF4347 domain-containing protein [Nostoc sp. FACHB-87]MBD2474108.1 DUF4347 domain-containing protein [Anabaena sp. FACHB-83]